MKINYLLGAMGVVALLGISACGDDDPPPKSGITFELESFETLESDGTLTSFHPDLGFTGSVGRDIVVKILLDRELSETTVVQYSVSGTATRTNPAGNPVNDLAIKDGLNTIVGTDKITIEKGAVEATIIITVYEDFSFEVDDDDSPIETAIITLTSISSGNAELGLTDTYTLSIEEDDAFILHQWYVDGTDEYGDVDMDLFVWLEDDLINNSTNDNASWDEDFPPYEALFIPAGFPNGTYEMSYTYYSGTSDDVDVVALMWGRLNGDIYPYFSFEDDEVLVFEANYGLANINNWLESEIDPMRVQSMIKTGLNYSNISQIAVPESGSRIGSSRIKLNRNSLPKIGDLKMKMIDIPTGLLKR
jgi:hypothetical protein